MTEFEMDCKLKFRKLDDGRVLVYADIPGAMLDDQGPHRMALGYVSRPDDTVPVAFHGILMTEFRFLVRE